MTGEKLILMLKADKDIEGVFINDMMCMFFNDIDFNKPLNKLDVSNVTDMHFLFHGAIAFNQPLDSWDVSNVKNMSFMFADARAFQQDISMWKIHKDCDVKDMFGYGRGWEWYLKHKDLILEYGLGKAIGITVGTISKK